MPHPSSHPAKLSRRRFTQSAAATLASGLLWPLDSAQALARRPAGPQRRVKNVLMLAVDDLRPELGCYGKRHIHSPRIDRFAASATRFDRAYCQFPQCGPSRCSLFAGVRPETARQADGPVTHIDRNAMYRELATLPAHLTAQGYRTACFGKLYHHPADDTKSWTDPHPDDREALAPIWGYPGYGLASNVEHTARIRRERRAAGQQGYFNGPSVEAADLPDDAYYDGITTNRTVAMLRDMASDAERPFFLAAGWYKPHLAFCAPKRYWDLYDRDAIEPATNNEHPGGAPGAAINPWAMNELRGYSDIPDEGPLSEAKQRELIHGYYACVSFIDAQIGRVLDALDSLGLADDTVVLLWGDHGFHLGENGHWTKNINWELSHHSPLLIRTPDLRDGQSTRGLTEFVDIYPTIVEACGLPQPAHELEGQSLLPLMQRPDRAWKSAAFTLFANNLSMRTDCYRYTPYADRNGDPAGVELYDLDHDPGANVNVANQPQYQSIRKQLAAQHAAGWRAARAEL
ncbi:sulfatase [Mucisphaera calidilacus]|uniref:Arylsulfatase n=1 Tax=Mucisphaera calidilacus TaxID=2527982 RepID=A0A518BWZ1_9BACT|nr:sulfatase [Mucisphaera calidilacus]QDU71486.1 Arylsulfatase [Mucisphaera calidilacus]